MRKIGLSLVLLGVLSAAIAQEKASLHAEELSGVYDCVGDDAH